MFFLLLFVMGGTTCLVEGLFFLFFTKELQASNMLCGLSVAITVSFEVPIFHHSAWLLKRFNNHQLMTASCLAYIFRVIWYTSTSNPWMVLVVEPLHGITFACKALAAVHYAAELAPPGLQTSAQGLSNTVQCMGVITGSVLGGYLMDTRGSVFLYRSAALLSGVTLCLYLAVTLQYSGADSLFSKKIASEGEGESEPVSSAGGGGGRGRGGDQREREKGGKHEDLKGAKGRSRERETRPSLKGGGGEDEEEGRGGKGREP